MPDSTAWDEYCEASLDLSNQDDIGDPMQAPPIDDGRATVLVTPVDCT